jgi:hypothetical protein
MSHPSPTVPAARAFFMWPLFVPRAHGSRQLDLAGGQHGCAVSPSCARWWALGDGYVRYGSWRSLADTFQTPMCSYEHGRIWPQGGRKSALALLGCGWSTECCRLRDEEELQSGICCLPDAPPAFELVFLTSH